jgi:aspartokinase-like uncharacterized kinase
MTAAAPARVVKLGGSLLEWPQWPVRLQTWLARQPLAVNVVVVGGGSLVEAIRTLDRQHGLTAEASHWLAIRAMSVTAQLAAELLPAAQLIDSLAQVRRSPGGPLQILDVAMFLLAEEFTPGALPCSWDVTSDSIAARLATALDAELVLLKSALPGSGDLDVQGDAAALVDAYFATAARGLSVRLVNLRDAEFAESALPTT